MPEHTYPVIDDGRTRVADTPPPKPLGPQQAFLVAYHRLALLARVASGPAFVVAAVDPRASVVESMLIQDRDALTIGRHSHAGLHLGAESTSLRHLAALVRYEGGRPVLRVWDLHTTIPFITEDGEPNAAVVAEGPLYVSIEGYALWFLPVEGAWPEDPDAAFRALPARSFIDRRSPEARPFVPRVVPSAPRAFIDEDRTRVTRVAAPLLLGDGDEPEIGWGEIRLANGEHKQRRVVSAERLEQGLLLGRYERCGVILEGVDKISRVHLLLVRIGAEVWAIDTGSTHGVRCGDTPLRAGVLRDSETLTLANVVTLDWRRTSHAEA